MIIEKKRMEMLENGGIIRLEKLAIPETVIVTLFGERIIPESFNYYGNPMFTKEQAMLFMYKEEELRRQKRDQNLILEVEVTYEERIFDVPRSTFDTIRGIEKSLLSLSDLNEMLHNRRIFCKAHKNERLNEYMLFGCFWLDQFGQIMSVEKAATGKLRIKEDVEDFETFRRNNSGQGVTLTSGGYAIPTVGSVCPCCGKTFTIDDLKNNPCVYIDDKYYHDSCWRNYRKLTEIDKFTRRLMSNIYKEADYTFELLPNGYCKEECCMHIPWFLFHTIDGDIKMGWRKRVISIEWQENYKYFDMNELFATENVTKWEENGKHGIHAWGDKKASEYLEKVVKTVNPGYRKY